MSRNNRMPPQVETASNSSSGPRIQQRLTDQQRINAQLLQKVQVLEEKYNQLEQQMQQQTEPAANLPLSKTPIKGREDYNNLLCRDYREAYEHCGKEWDLDRSLMNKQGNYDILQEVIRIALQSDLVKRLHGDPTSATGFKSPAQKDTAIQMIRSHFDYLRDVRNQQVRLSEDQRRRRRYRRKVGYRNSRIEELRSPRWKIVRKLNFLMATPWRRKSVSLSSWRRSCRKKRTMRSWEKGWQKTSDLSVSTGDPKKQTIFSTTWIRSSRRVPSKTTKDWTEE